MFNQHTRLNSQPEWEFLRQALLEKTGLTEAQLAEIGEIEGDSLDLVEIVMAFEEKYQTKIALGK